MKEVARCLVQAHDAVMTADDMVEEEHCQDKDAEDVGAALWFVFSNNLQQFQARTEHQYTSRYCFELEGRETSSYKIPKRISTARGLCIL